MTDTTRAAVERLAAFHEGEGQYLEVAEGVGDEISITYGETARTTAATLRALVAERDAAVNRERATMAMIKARGTNRDYWEATAQKAMQERDAALARMERLTVECEQDMMRAEAERDAARAEAARLRDTASTSDDEDAITAEDEDRAFLGLSDEDDDE
jgi:hypothetical protein